MERRDFFGIIAAPLLRRLAPPTPIATSGEQSALLIDRLGAYSCNRYSQSIQIPFSAITNDDLASRVNLPKAFGVSSHREVKKLLSHFGKYEERAQWD